MVEKMKQNVVIPAWALTIIVTLFVTISGFLITVTAQASRVQEKVTDNEQRIKEHEKVFRLELEKKADQKDMDRVYQMLDKIDEKLDRIIENK